MTFRIILPVVLLCSASFAVSAEGIAPMALNSIGTVPPRIQGAPVEDEHGVVVGHLAKIETDVEGKPLRADIALNGGSIVFLETGSLSYDESANLLVTALSGQQLTQLANGRSG